MANQVKRLWAVDVTDRKTKQLSKEQRLVLAKDLLEALQKAQTFLDEKYGKKKFEAVAAEFEGTIDVF